MDNWQERFGKLREMRDKVAQERQDDLSKYREKLEALQSRIKPICVSFSSSIDWKFDCRERDRWRIYLFYEGQSLACIWLDFKDFSDTFEVIALHHGTISTIDIRGSSVEDELADALEKAYKVLYIDKYYRK